MSLTTSVCLTLLLSGGPQLNPAGPAEETAAAEWLNSLNQPNPGAEQIQTTLTHWAIWKASTPAARNAHLALELRGLSPEADAQILPFSGRHLLLELSAKNLKRLKEKILTRIAIPREPDPMTAQRIDVMTSNLAFHYLTRDRRTRETGVNPPLASPRELAKLKLNHAPSFYSQLLQDSPSVAFTVVATKAKMSPYSINSQVPFRALRLSDDLAREAGFVLPNFANAQELIQFFDQWEPELLTPLLRHNRLSLPLSIKTVEQFKAHLHPGRIQEIFPDDKAFERLSVLRERLRDYVLTEQDARDLLQWAFARWLARVALNDAQEFAYIEKEFTLAAGPQNVFTQKFLPELGLKDLQLRVPLAVGPQSYSILRVEGIAYNPFPDYTRKSLPPWDSRRLDHTAMP